MFDSTVKENLFWAFIVKTGSRLGAVVAAPDPVQDPPASAAAATTGALTVKDCVLSLCV